MGEVIWKSAGMAERTVLRRRITIEGRVQGVGFRPFVARLARSLGLSGFIANAPGNVVLEVQGPADCLRTFRSHLCADLPSGAVIERIGARRILPLPEETEFSIAPSIESGPAEGKGLSSLLPDTATCSDCLRELFDPGNRRYRYPLISCTACGPRYSIATSTPFDRCRTTLRRYPLCPQCRLEFNDPGDRRFHSQTIGCPGCGPRTWFLDGKGQGRTAHAPLERSVAVLRSGGILAVKGLGGYHLACDAANKKAVARLRTLKGRPDKPLAVMAGTLEGLASLVRISSSARRVLLSPERPIVLLPFRLAAAATLGEVAPGLDRLGVFLPVTPIQHLLFGDPDGPLPPLVMTSANPEGVPMAINEREILAHFRDRVEGFLVHGRRIDQGIDDSLILPGKSPLLLRRARGWVPTPFFVHKKSAALPGPVVLAFGAHQKTAPCRLAGGKALMLPHLGDLDSPESRTHYRDRLCQFLSREQGSPTHLACDLHPDFPSSRLAAEWGSRWGIPVVPVQHHHAHVASVIADRKISGPVLGLALDGFGLGSDGGFWGGELLRVDRSGAVRLGHFSSLPLPGGERAFREPWRMGVAALCAIGEEELAQERFSSPLVPDLLGLLKGSTDSLFPETTSAGRLFDAVYALLGGCERISYEGQGAMELETWARRGSAGAWGSFQDLTRVAEGELDVRPLLRRLSRIGSPEDGARLFHEALASGLGNLVLGARDRSGIETLVLAGGVFQNRLLVRLLRRCLSRTGMKIFEARGVPPNDGGISLGQAWVVGSSVMGDMGSP